jgi:hypothetical protein
VALPGQLMSALAHTTLVPSCEFLAVNSSLIGVLFTFEEAKMRHAIVIRLVTSVQLVSLLLFAGYGRSQEKAAIIPSRPDRQQAKEKRAVNIERLIRQLGSERFADREAASKALEIIGEPAWTALCRDQNDPDLEIRRRIAELRKSLAKARAPMRAKAWAALVKLNGRVGSDTGASDGCIGGIDFVTAVTLCDSDLAALQWLDEARCVGFIGNRITDAALVHLEKLYRLEILELGQTNVTDAGLVHLKGVPMLLYVDLTGTKVTDKGIAELEMALPKLKIVKNE